MINATNAPSSINPTLAAIEGGLNSQLLPMSQKPKLLDQVRHAIRTRHYSDRTETAYVHWIKRYIFFHDKRHPLEMAEPEIARFLSNLATEGRRQRVDPEPSV